jgi:hypothetical protein
VSTVRVDLQSNVCYVTPDRRTELPLADVPRAVKRAGFRPDEMIIRATGAYEGRLFRIAGWHAPLTVKVEGLVPQGSVTLRARVDYSGEALILEPLP